MAKLIAGLMISVGLTSVGVSAVLDKAYTNSIVMVKRHNADCVIIIRSDHFTEFQCVGSDNTVVEKEGS